MKILGLTYHGGTRQTYLKPDAALLVNEKPFFLPAFSEQILFRPCWVVRVSRLGRNIEKRFASRYYDAWTVGMNMCAADCLQKAQSEGANWLEAIAFDNSLPLGEMQALEDMPAEVLWMRNEEKAFRMPTESLQIAIDEAIECLSKYVTIRMGDLIAVEMPNDETYTATPEDKWQAQMNDKNLLSCKVK